MDELNLLTKRILTILAQGEIGITTLQGFSEEKKPNPLRGNLAVASLQKIEISALGLGDWGGAENMPAFSHAKKMEAEFRIVLCSPKSGKACWSFFERVAGRLAFSEEIAVIRLECGQMNYNRDWGGMAMPVMVRCLFGLTDNMQQDYVKAEEVRVTATLA